MNFGWFLRFSLACVLLANMTTESQAQESRGNPCRPCLKQAAQLFARGKNQEALDELEKSRSDCLKESQYFLLMSTILERQGLHPDIQEQAAQESVKLSPDCLPCAMQYGFALLANQKLPEAKIQLEKVTKLDQSNYDSWLALAEIYERLHEDTKASSARAKAAELHP